MVERCQEGGWDYKSEKRAEKGHRSFTLPMLCTGPQPRGLQAGHESSMMTQP